MFSEAGISYRSIVKCVKSSDSVFVPFDPSLGSRYANRKRNAMPEIYFVEDLVLTSEQACVNGTDISEDNGDSTVKIILSD